MTDRDTPTAGLLARDHGEVETYWISYLEPKPGRQPDTAHCQHYATEELAMAAATARVGEYLAQPQIVAKITREPVAKVRGDYSIIADWFRARANPSTTRSDK
jgi:hypothetical protein